MYCPIFGSSFRNCPIPKTFFPKTRFTMCTKLINAVVVLTLVIPSLFANSASYNNSNANTNFLENTLICPTLAVPFDNDPGDCGAVVVVPNPSSSDPVNCPLDSVFNDFIGAVAMDANGLYPVGTTTVEFIGFFANGTMDTCTVDVIVVDSEPPLAVCNDVTVYLDETGGATIDINEVAAGSSDNCGDVTLSLNIDDAFCNDKNIPKTITLTVTDLAGNTTSCMAECTALDTLAPMLDCKTELTAQCAVSEQAPYADLLAFIADGNCVSDNCFIDTSSFMFVSDVSSGTTCPDTIFRTYSISDECGNLDSCVQLIIVDDTEAPDLVVPANLSLDCTEDETDLALTGMATATDNCSMPLPTFTDNFIAGGVCPQMGTLLRTWTVEDDCGNVSSAIQEIMIMDNTGPVFDPLPAITPDIIACNDPLPVHPEATAMDDCSSITLITMDTIPFTEDICAGYTITYTWTATDECNNETVETADITVLADTTPPSITGTPPVYTDINCNNPFPPFGDLTTMDDCASVTIDTTMSFVENVCTGYEVSYSWTPTDACGNVGAAVTTTFMVLPDTAPPVAVCADQTFPTDMGVCEAMVSITPPTVTDDCSTWTLSNDVTDATNTAVFPVGTTAVTWTIIDACGNQGSCVQMITVEDQETPEIVCNDDLIVNLNNIGFGQVYDAHIILGATDNCHLGDIVLRKMTDLCGDPTNTDMVGNSLTFCCEEVKNTPMIIASVSDTSGNVTECMVEVQVEDKLPPSIGQLLPDITISCEFEYDLADLSVFGTYVSDAAFVSDIVINDIFYTAPDFIAGQDGVVAENCPESLNITETATEDIYCGQGEITRTFTFTDCSGNVGGASQTIFIEDGDPFSLSDITWPDDFDFSSCVGVNLDPSITGAPTFVTDNCNLVMFSYEDDVFDSPNSGCPNIERQWTVIDWCTYVPNSGNTDGIYFHTQNINILNSVAPTFTTSIIDTLVCSNEIDCLGDFMFSVAAVDDCTDTEDLQFSFSLDLNGDGTIELTNYSDSFVYNDVDPGNHILTWYVEDRCGNIATEEVSIEVRDCQAPTPVCLNGLSAALVPGVGTVEIWATDFEASSYDNCTAFADLIWSFSADVTNNVVTFTCDDVGIQIVQMWLTDAAGNQAFCETFVDVQDNSDECPSQREEVSLAGQIQTEDDGPIMGAEVVLDLGEDQMVLMTNDQGSYMFEDLDAENDYMIAPEMAGDILDGVSTLDLVKIQRHVLGIEDLDSPYKIIAGDVNNSGSVTGIDIVELRKLILGIYTEFPSNDIWNFVSAGQVFPDPTDPFPYDQQIEYYDVDDDAMEGDFIAVKTGDVTGDNAYNLLQSEAEFRSSVELVIKEQTAANGVFRYAVSTDVYMDIYGLQMEWNVGSSPVTIESGLLDISTDNFVQDRAGVQLSWNSVDAISMDGGILFYLTSEQELENITLNTNRLRAELYDDNLESYSVRSGYETKQETELKNVPNPFSDQTTIYYSVNTDQTVEFVFYSLDGKIVKRVRIESLRGENTFHLSKDELGVQAGTIFYTLKTANTKITGKMLLVK